MPLPCHRIGNVPRPLVSDTPVMKWTTGPAPVNQAFVMGKSEEGKWPFSLLVGSKQASSYGVKSRLFASLNIDEAINAQPGGGHNGGFAT